MSEQKPEVKQKATEKLALVEKLSVGLARRVAAIEPALSGTIQDLDLLREALTLLNRKIDAIAQLLNLEDKTINSKMVSINEAQLKKMIDDQVEQGNLVASVEISSNSVIVGQEIEKVTGTVKNPRLQFAVAGLDKDFAAKLISKKAGEIVDGGEGNLDLLVTEVYEIVRKEEASQESEQESVAQ